jgi:electron transport complex protein RnfG
MKRMQMLKLGIILAIYCIVGSVGLAFVYNTTSKVIAQRQADDLQVGLKEVFPTASSFEPTDKVKSPNKKIIFDGAYTAKSSSGTLGIAVKVEGPSYGGTTTLLVGVSVNGTITGVKVLENKDTPGLGANAANPTYYVNKATKTTFPGQFAGKKLTDAFEVKKDVIAITSATITSRSITGIVQTVSKATSDALGIGQPTTAPGTDKVLALVPGADMKRVATSPAVSANPDVTILETYVATKSGKVVGAVAKAESKGYEGRIIGYVGVSTDGVITGVSFVSSTDTPGLGDQVLKSSFMKQFVGLKATDPITVRSGIMAITGATYSSAGAALLVKTAADALVKAIAGGAL